MPIKRPLPRFEEESEPDSADIKLITRIAVARDSGAMEVLYIRYRPRLVGFLHRLTHDNDLIEESYNDVMVRVWEKAHQYQGHSKVSSWIFSIAYRTCLRLVKKQKRRDTFFELVGQDLPEAEVVHEESSIDDELLNKQIKKLPAKQRLVIELCYFEGYSMDEIGKIVDVPVNTVKTRLHHARKKIRIALEREQTESIADMRGF